VTPRQAVGRDAARGISISKLERRGLDDAAFRAGCSLLDPYACCEPCWHSWKCARLMEHLRGEQYWEELDHGDYGLLRRRSWHADFELVGEVVARVATGADTVAVLVWAAEKDKSLDGVAAILRTLDVNARRLARFDWLSWAPPCGRA
jgi:hypothetical protein